MACREKQVSEEQDNLVEAAPAYPPQLLPEYGEFSPAEPEDPNEIETPPAVPETQPEPPLMEPAKFTPGKITLDLEVRNRFVGGKYNSTFHPIMAMSLRRRGVSRAQTARELGITLFTLRNWEKRHPQFAAAMGQSIHRTRGEIEESALRAAQGGFVEEVITVVEVLDDGSERVVSKKIHRKYIKPDPVMGIFLLTNLMPDTYKHQNRLSAAQNIQKQVNVFNAAMPPGMDAETMKSRLSPEEYRQFEQHLGKIFGGRAKALPEGVQPLSTGAGPAPITAETVPAQAGGAGGTAGTDAAPAATPAVP